MAAQHTDFLPRLSLERQSNNLRSLSDSFVGRERELADLRALLSAPDTRLLTLAGPGGYGKSRLAAELCARLLGGFGQGVFEVRLARISSAARLADAVAAATGLQLAGSRSAAQQVLDYLREKELLLHIENLEHMLPGAEFLADIRREAPGVRLLVSCRTPLGLPGETVYSLGPLLGGPGSDSVYLFAARAQQVQPGFTLDAAAAASIQRLCGVLGGVPLAIELVAAWADAVPPAAVEGELGAAGPAGPVRAACAWSWRRLEEDERTALMQLATFRGGFFAVEAQALLGLAGPRLERLLAELCRRSWLQPFTADGRTRYTIRNVVQREYAWEQLEGARPDAPGQDGSAAGAAPEGLYDRALRAHARCFAQLLEAEGERLKGDPATHGRGQLTALHRLKLLEKENLLAALDWALGHGALDSLLPLARHLGRLMEMTSEFALLEETYTRLLEGAARWAEPELELYARSGLAAAAYRLGRFDDCRAAVPLISGLAQRLGRTAAAADALRLLGLIDYTQGAYAAALAALEEGLGLARAAPDPYGEASVLNNLGMVEVALGQRAAARGHFTACLELRRAGGDRYGEAMCLNNLSNLEQREGHLDEALVQAHQCLAIRREICDLHGQAGSLGNLAIAYYSRGDVDAARDSFGKAYAIQHSLGDRLGMAGMLNNLGAVERAQRNFPTARDFYRRAIALAREIGYGLAEATALLNLGNAECALGEWATGRAAYAQALPVLLRLGGLNYLPKAVALAGAALAQAGVWPAAVAAMHGGVLRCPERHCHIEPDEQELLDAGWAAVGQGLAAGRLTPAAVETARAAGAARELDSLAQETSDALHAGLS
jgi:tetratricopeptide (TPR) repeat protein